MKTSRNNKKFTLFSQLILGSISFVGVLFAADTPDSVDVNLLDFEVWQRERGYWLGEYTFLNSSGKSDYEATDDSTSGQYDYRRYFGFISLQVKGNELKQRNIFLRPALDLEGKDLDEDGTVSVNELDAFGFSSPFDYAIDLQTKVATPLQSNGDAAELIPFNYSEGTEKTFTADQSASDQSGNLSGLYFGFPTTTTIIGDDTVLYRVGDSPIFQNQLTTLPGNGVRVRTAQGFSFGSSLPSYGSYYRETKFEDDVDEQGVVIITAREKFLLKLEEYRQLYNVPAVNQIADVEDFFTTGLEPTEEELEPTEEELEPTEEELEPTEEELEPAEEELEPAEEELEPTDSENVDLLDFEVWRRERGYWFGEYTFLNSAGKSDYEATDDPTSGQYDYRRYFGFINLQVKGNELKQRNIFLRPALDLEGKDLDEDGTVSVNELDAFGFSSPFDYAIDLQTKVATPLQSNGDAAELIPFNYSEGTEKTFTADQSASDQSGNLSGLYFGFPTTTTIIGDDTVLYRVGDSPIFQNQLTTLPGNGVRVRTAQGFSFGSSLPSYGSYYRETKFEDDVDEQGVVIITAREKFLLKLEEYRQLYNVPEVNQIADVEDFFTTGLEPAEEQDAKPNEDPIAGESGDMNADGVVNVFDIEPFILALNNPVEFTETTGVDSKTGDLNGDGQVNVFDIEPFVNALNGSTNDPELAQFQAATIKSRVDAYPQGPIHYEAWAEEQGLHSKNNAPYADPNGDGLVNLAAYTIGASALGNNEINVGIETKGDSTTLRFSSPHYVTGVHIGTEVSTALRTGAWTPGPRPVLVRSNSTQNYYEVTIPRNGNRQFARLTFVETR